MKGECLICKKEISIRYNRKTCSEKCLKKHRNNYQKKQRIKNSKAYECQFCGKRFERYRKRNGFCSRSCASKKYVQDGTYDVWKNTKIKRKGIYKKCVTCDIEYYVGKTSEKESSKTCSKKCHYKSHSIKMSGDGNPQFGKTEAKTSKEKRIKTLQEKYGVQNAYELANHNTSTKSQMEIMHKLNEEFGNDSFTSEVKIGNYRVDMVCEKEKVIVEYNGGYWHCDPRFYEKDYFHKKKNLSASDIWKKDRKRLKFLEEQGYTIKVIWEYDYLQNKKDTITKIKEEIYGR